MENKEKHCLVDRGSIRAYMGKNQISVEQMSTSLGVSATTFRLKMSGRISFKENEILKLIEMGCIFFNRLVPKNEIFD